LRGRKGSTATEKCKHRPLSTSHDKRERTR
jgi:hypothetical protein